MNKPTAYSLVGEGRALLRVAEVADILGVSPRVAYEWLIRGVIPPEVMVRAGRAVYVKRLALEAWLAGRDGMEPPAPA
jgi:excisionase family DNA binding protein